MNIHNSGKIPESLKKLAAIIALLSVTASAAGCSSSDTSSAAPASSYYESETHLPTPDSSASESTAASVGATSSASVPAVSSAAASSSSSSAAPDSSAVSVVSSAQEESSAPPEASSAESSVTAPPAPSEPVSEPPVPQPPESSSEPYSEPEPDPPPVVEVPYIDMPSSPGTDAEVTSTAVIDYSNAHKGYVSARYNGSSGKVKFRIESGGQTYTFNLDPNNRTEYFPLTCGSGTYTFYVYENTTGTKFAEAASVSVSVSISNSLSPYLYTNQYCVYSASSNCVYKAAELCAGKSGTIDKIGAIFQWVAANVKYDNYLAETVQSGYLPDPDRTYAIRTGICFDYASLMCAMLRSQGIPTRIVVGYASPDIYHAWNEIYTEETGWITPEILFKNAGYNLADSTVYSLNSNKQSAADYIMNGSNYQALYYY